MYYYCNHVIICTVIVGNNKPSHFTKMQPTQMCMFVFFEQTLNNTDQEKTSNRFNI